MFAMGVPSPCTGSEEGGGGGASPVEVATRGLGCVGGVGGGQLDVKGVFLIPAPPLPPSSSTGAGQVPPPSSEIG